MLKFIFKFFSISFLIPILLIITSPVFFPIYTLLIFFLIIFRIIKAAFNYLIGEPILLADSLSAVINAKPHPRPPRTPDRLIPCGNCLIEEFRKEGVYRIFPEEANLGLNYKTLNEAKEQLSLYG